MPSCAVIVLFLAALSSAYSLLCPEGCRCTKMLDCSSVQPDRSELKVTGMNLNDSLSRDTTNPFMYLNALRTLNLTDNGITVVSSRTFEPLINIKEIILDSNYLRKLDTQTFQGNKLLYVLRLNKNPFEMMPVLSVPSLGWLELDSCNLTELPMDMFDNITAIFYLSLDDNRLHKLPQQPFQKLTSLSHLHIRRNLLTTLDPDTFAKNELLHVLYLENNPLVLPQDAPLLVSRSLLILDLSICNITDIPNRIFFGLPRLRSLKLENNNLKEITFQRFSKLHELKVLNLRKNRLTEVKTETLYNLRFKNLFIDLLDNPLNCDCSIIRCQLFIKKCIVNNVSLELPCSSEEMKFCPNWSLSSQLVDSHSFTGDLGELKKKSTLQLVPREEPESMRINAAYLTAGIGAGVGVLILLALALATVRACRRKGVPASVAEEDLFLKQSVR